MSLHLPSYTKLVLNIFCEETKFQSLLSNHFSKAGSIDRDGQ